MSDMLLFDIDNTLLDTKKLMNHFIKPALQEHLLSDPETFTQVSDRYWLTLDKKTAFDPEQYLMHLAVSFEAQLPVLHQIFYKPDFFVQSLFPDVKETLDTLKKKFRLGIFSEGKTDYQLQKLELAGIREEFETELLFTSLAKTAPDFLDRLPGAKIVDDRLAVIEALAQEPRFEPIWLNRESLTQKTDTYCDTIYTLSELPALLDL